MFKALDPLTEMILNGTQPDMTTLKVVEYWVPKAGTQNLDRVNIFQLMGHTDLLNWQIVFGTGRIFWGIHPL